MKSIFEADDIQAIASAVTEFLKPQFANLKVGEADDRIMGVPDLAKYLGMSDKWIYDQTSQKSIPFFKLGNVLKFRQKEIDKWLRSFKIPATEQPTALMKLVRR